jgi:hypothetical protein
VLGIHIDFNVADLLIALQMLRSDVHAVLGKHIVIYRHHTRFVSVNVQHMVAPLFPGDATSGILTELAVEFFELHPFRTPVVAPNHCVFH